MFHWENFGDNPFLIKIFFGLCFWVPVIISCIANALDVPPPKDPDNGFYDVYDEEYEDW